MALVTYGYLERPYLMDSYLAGLGTTSMPSQFSRKIVSAKVIRVQFNRKAQGSKAARSQVDRKIAGNVTPIRSQFNRRIVSKKAIRAQFDRRVVSSKRIRAQYSRLVGSVSAVRSQFARKVNRTKAVRAQFLRQIFGLKRIKLQFSRLVGSTAIARSQFSRKVNASKAIKAQYIRKIFSIKRVRGQFNRLLVAQKKTTHFSFKRGPVSHQICQGYLTEPYLVGPYLARKVCAHLYMQFDRKVRKDKPIRVQFNRKAAALKKLRTQYDRKVSAKTSTHFQFTMQTNRSVRMQFLRAIYNTNLLRILWTFPSRGITGLNWTVAAGGQMPGDFDINNVNTDIVEQVYRSTGTSITINCDTQISQGIFTDTLGVLNHNLTTSASVVFQATNDPTYSSILKSVTLPASRENIYWIAPALPTASYRYWRFVISDPTNQDGYIQLGTIVFGPALIFSGQSFTDEVVKRKIHFADRVRTSGFSNVSNDRALKRAFTIRFRRLLFNDANFQQLNVVFDYIRTSLKALWIPTPQYPERFACFGKLPEIPEENHLSFGKNEDWIDLDVTVDESL